MKNSVVFPVSQIRSVPEFARATTVMKKSGSKTQTRLFKVRRVKLHTARTVTTKEIHSMISQLEKHTTKRQFRQRRQHNTIILARLTVDFACKG